MGLTDLFSIFSTGHNPQNNLDNSIRVFTPQFLNSLVDLDNSKLNSSVIEDFNRWSYEAILLMPLKQASYLANNEICINEYNIYDGLKKLLMRVKISFFINGGKPCSISINSLESPEETLILTFSESSCAAGEVQRVVFDLNTNVHMVSEYTYNNTQYFIYAGLKKSNFNEA